MELAEKAEALADGGRWDLSMDGIFMRNALGDVVSCSYGNCRMRLFKTLMSNSCRLDCKYCQNSAYRRQPKLSYEPAELARVFMHFYARNMVDGLFLSSAVCGDPDSEMGRMLEAVRLLRESYRFNGYVHFKILPGSSKELVRQACYYASRVSVNIEAPGGNRLSELTTGKDFELDLLRRQSWIARMKPAGGQTTQMVVGAGDETDQEILETADFEYRRMNVSRVYYSRFVPVEGTPLEGMRMAPPERERRLYNADYLMRFYGITLSEIEGIMEDGNLPAGDPKARLALKCFDSAVDVNSAGYDELVRIPGIGPGSAGRIIALRERGLRVKCGRDLRSIGVALKRAEPFIIIDGGRQGRIQGYRRL
ncbi:MAG: helix-hairpin-helix domain-containing protein [Candidatus Altiarchaeota archaeon]|nr:helix-hairpin-helix domain-containing protein [Candidatus Altiarchaeota archaeon]